MSMKSLTKICSKCNMEKQIEDFINMKSSICKECQREYNRQQCQFNYTSPNDREFKICWSLMNLRPLWCTDNWSRNKSTCNDISNELKEKILSQYSNET